MQRESRNFGGLGLTIALAVLMFALVVISGVFLVQSDAGLQTVAPFQFAVPSPVPPAPPKPTHTDHLRQKHQRVARIVRQHHGKNA